MVTELRPDRSNGVADAVTGFQLLPIARSQQRRRISDLVTDELTAAIRDLRLEPGAVLSETELSRQLQVSRTPLREAISRLVDRRLLTVASQVGTRVARIDLEAVEQAVFIRCALETAAYRQACRTGSHRDVERLRQILEHQEHAVATQEADLFFITDEDLHQEIFRLGGHPDVWDVVRQSKLQLDRLRRLVIPDAISSRWLIDEHSQLVDLLEDGDVDAGVQLIQEHAGHVLRQAPQFRSRFPGYFTSEPEARDRL